MKEIIKRIHIETFCDYSKNSINLKEVRVFSDLVFYKYNIKLDNSYLKFISMLNGFELNGLNFYGTKEFQDLYILSIIKQNDFWKPELLGLKECLLIADGDMDFYCFNPVCNEYFVLTKGSLQEVARFSNFMDFLSELVRIYSVFL